MKINGMSKTACFKQMKVSSTGYYNWLNQKEDREQREAEAREEKNQIKENMRQIIKKLGFVPGKRTFKVHLYRDYGLTISIKRCRRLMMEMHLVANLPKKDAYKGQAKHFHEACALQNHVQQDFKVGPRRVILTDITYLYYGEHRELFYLCAFKDAFTTQILGWHTSRKMNIDLVKNAYENMMDKHNNEFKKDVKVYVHSDQGSQYLSTDFKRLVSDDDFIQSVSARGNSQDNAPMESFFGRMKTEVMDIIALCPDFETATRLVNGYINNHNDVRYQYDLAGLTPNEYYDYMMSGIYPLDSYFGVKAEDLLTAKQIVETRMAKAREKAQKRREASQKKREERAKLTSVADILVRDQKKVKQQIKVWNNSHETANKQLIHLNKILEMTKVAVEFYRKASPELKELLKNPLKWKDYPELAYVNELGPLY